MTHPPITLSQLYNPLSQTTCYNLGKFKICRLIFTMVNCFTSVKYNIDYISITFKIHPYAHPFLPQFMYFAGFVNLVGFNDIHISIIRRI